MLNLSLVNGHECLQTQERSFGWLCEIDVETPKGGEFITFQTWLVRNLAWCTMIFCDVDDDDDGDDDIWWWWWWWRRRRRWRRRRWWGSYDDLMMILWWSYDELMMILWWSYDPVAIMIFVARMGRKILYDIGYSMAWIDGKYWCAFSRLFLLAFHVSWIAFFRLGLKLDYNDTSVGAVCLDFRVVGSCWILLIWNTVWPDDLQWQCFMRTGAACLLYKVFTPKHGQQFTVLVYEKPRISELVESGPSGCLLTEGSHCHVVQESIYRYMYPTYLYLFILWFKIKM